jgi:dihydrodipicolinate synthase/N-acetylneuraminate lyase
VDSRRRNPAGKGDTLRRARGQLLNVRKHLLAGTVIPAHPLALTAKRTLDEERQRALTRYYIDAGAGGVAVGVHTTQFAIRDRAVGLLKPVLELAAETARTWKPRASAGRRSFALVAGIRGDTKAAVGEASLAVSLGYHAGLVSLAELSDASDERLVAHCRAVAEVMPIFGFYLQPAVGGRPLGYSFWRELAEIKNLIAIKIAPFNRYATFDVVRAVADAERDDVALYTGNDDSIIVDLLTPFPCRVASGTVVRRIVGGLLGQWSMWTRRAVELLQHIKAAGADDLVDRKWLAGAAALTDANGAIFDAPHGFAGCIPGIHEVLRRQGLLRGIWCLDPREGLSPGQSSEIDRVLRSYPDLNDDEFVAENLDRWLS